MSHISNASMRELTEEQLADVMGGANLHTTVEIVRPILTAQMIANPDISAYFVPHINVVPKG